MSVVGQDAPGKTVLLMGNEAIARGAIEAGVQVVAGYPGTPSTEIVETLAGVSQEHGLYTEWSINEKVAFEVAAGAALTGARALVAMKNAGLNWVMDTFMTITYGGVRGGFVVVVADDPGAHYSSNEQDTRIAAKYAEIPCFEPMDQQQAKDMTKEAFRLSEELELPVFVRSVTRISHASGDVQLGEIEKIEQPGFNKHWKIPYRWNVYGPPGPVSKHEWLHSRQPIAAEYVGRSPFNQLVRGTSRVGVVASGVAAVYAIEALKDLGLEGAVNFLRIGTVNPFPKALASELLKSSDTIVCIEEGDPMVELDLGLLAREVAPQVKLVGKYHEPVLKPYGELNPDIVVEALAKALGIQRTVDSQRLALKDEIRQLVPPRSSTLCPGCGHLGTYWALKWVLQKEPGVPIVNGDIGCYEQGGYGVFSKKIEVNDSPSKRYRTESPYEILDTLYVMGSGIGLSQGEYQARHDAKVVAVAGDSTFFHSTLPALVNAVHNKANITFIVLDNRWTSMTGHQPNPVTGTTVTGIESKILKIEDVIPALGVDFIRVVDSYDLAATTEGIREAVAYEGLSVVVAKRECALQVQRRVGKRRATSTVSNACNGCKICVALGCPGIIFQDGRASIDPALCVDCGMCYQTCPKDAISDGSRV